MLNFGTTVMGPEVYLKALSMARNVAHQEGRKINRFTTAVFDLIDLGDDLGHEASKTERATTTAPSRPSWSERSRTAVRAFMSRRSSGDADGAVSNGGRANSLSMFKPRPYPPTLGCADDHREEPIAHRDRSDLDDRSPRSYRPHLLP